MRPPYSRVATSVGLLAAVVGYLVVSTYQGATEADTAILRRHPVAPPFVVYRALAPRNVHGRVAVLELVPAAEPRVTRLECARVHYAGGRGLCTRQEQRAGKLVNVAYVFDRTFAGGRAVVLSGIPTRVRVARSGRVGAITTYAEQETSEGVRLATTTQLIDLARGRAIANLHEFEIDNFNLPPIRGPVDISGVAFERGGDRFFATLITPGERYLVTGSISERRLTTLRTGVSGEALSPDGRRLAVKRLLPERGFWQLAVIELDSWSEQELQQGARSVDDQVEWLDDEHLLYHDVDGETTSLWMLPADGVTGPTVVVSDASSGAVQR